MVMLLECNNDVNETTSRLIDSTFLVAFSAAAFHFLQDLCRR